MSTRRPDGYPRQYEKRLVLDDGRAVHVRPVVPSDVEELSRAIDSADAETLRRRFLGGGPPRGLEQRLRLVTVDYVRRFAVAAFAEDGSGVGVARYEGETTWPTVDIAVAVHPAWREQGLARELLRLVVRRAVEKGAQYLSADFYADNVRVTDLLAEAHMPEQRTVSHGVVQDRIAVSGADLRDRS